MKFGRRDGALAIGQSEALKEQCSFSGSSIRNSGGLTWAAVTFVTAIVALLGHRLIKPHPNADGSKFYRSHEVGIVAVEACGDSAIVLEFVEEAFDAVAEFVGERAERGRIEAI